MHAKPFRFRIKHAVLAVLVAMMICVLITTYLNAATFYNAQCALLRESETLLLEQNAQSADATFRQIESIARSVAYNTAAQSYLSNTQPLKVFADYTQVTNLLNNSISLHEAILDIGVVGEGGKSCNINGSLEGVGELISDKSRASARSRMRFMGGQTYTILGYSYQVAVGIMDIYPLNSETAERIGSVWVALDPEKLFSFPAHGDTSRQFTYLAIDMNNVLITGTRAMCLSYISLGGELERAAAAGGYEIHSLTNDTYGFTFHSFIKMDVAFSSVFGIMMRYYVFQVVTFGVFILLMEALIAYFVRDMRKVITVVKSIATGESGAELTRIQIDGGKVISRDAEELAAELNRMLDEIQTLSESVMRTYAQIRDMELANKQMEIAYLRSQVNPHFLYNTLTLICGISSAGDTEKVIEVTEALAGIFRYSIKEREIVTLAEEMNIVSDYLTIQAERFDDCFQVSINIQERSREALIPAMMLQPLVENAIVHGLEPVQEAGRLEIGAKVDADDMLSIWVYDTGKGIEAERLKNIKRALNGASRSDATEERNWIGLYNVNKRIQLYYGDEYHLEIDSMEGLGTKMSIHIPFRMESEALNNKEAKP